MIRAGIMAVLSIIAGLISRKSNSINNLFFAALVILIINPITLVNTGFILSFCGTLGILLFSKPIVKQLSRFMNHKAAIESLGMTLSSQIILLPIISYTFHIISLISILTNLLIVPMWGSIMTLGFVTLFFSIFSIKIAKIPALVLTMLTRFIVAIAKLCSNINTLNITVIRPSIFFILIYYLFVYLLFSKNQLVKKHKKKGFIVIIILVFIFQAYYIIPKNYIEISSIDVGQGDSFFIRTSHNKKILIDGGGSRDNDYDVGESVLIPYLLNHQVTFIDLIIISHAHADHINGIFTVLEKLHVGAVMIGPQQNEDENIERLCQLCKEKNVKLLTISQGDNFMMDDIHFQVLYPSNEISTDNLNNYSLVIKMSYASRSMLFTGDIESEGELEMLKNVHEDELDVDILKVAHHGAKTSSTEEFLKRVKPEICVISVSAKNTYRSSQY